MAQKHIEILAARVETEFLRFVRRPSRYIGGEINQVNTDLKQCDLTFALCFPDVYEVGMSHMGFAIIYGILNKIEDVVAERVFAPWIDAEKIMREKKIGLFSLESKAAVASFDVVGFSLTNELCYTNVLNMLDLAGVKVRSRDRNEDEPMIIAGGTMANCCEPIAEFIDLFVIGEAEEAIVELVVVIRDLRKQRKSKKEILEMIAKQFDWAYVPSFYQPQYSSGKMKSLKRLIDGLAVQRESAVVEDFENATVPLEPIVPFTQAIHERVTVEIMRGCPGRCRFCQASFCRRPVRYRSIEKITELAEKSYRASGFDTVSLLSLSTADYPKLEELVTSLQECFQGRHVGFSLPSLRVDQQLKLVPKLASSVRKSGLTIAVEAANESLRSIINKPLKDEDLFAAVEAAYNSGWQKLKLYFMVGLPGESEKDVVRIVELCNDLARLRKDVDGRIGHINITISWFVPKPHTPFCWLGQRPKEYFEKARRLILEQKRNLRAKYLWFKFHNIERSLLESAVGRGDRRLGSVIELAWKNGAKFDLWDECFDSAIWRGAFEKFGMDVEAAAQKEFESQENLPWEHLGGPKKDYLLGHLSEAEQLIEQGRAG